jgi:molybdopterin-guanine dinucleotide biosynthesis protein A
MTGIVGVVLAGGLARRMGGGDKGLIELEGRPILDHVLARLAPQVDCIVINANGAPARLAGYGLPIVPDSVEGFAGPLAGVLAGMEWAARECPDADWIVTAATDTPFFPRDLVARFEQAVADEGADIVCAASGGRRHPVFGLWPVALSADLARAMTVEGVRKVDLWTARHRLAIAEYADRPYDPFFNVNRPEDVAEAERIAQGGIARDHIATEHPV